MNGPLARMREGAVMWVAYITTWSRPDFLPM